jgi:Na+-translocating ferredoxin:NAD+ oxidoreductase RnfD subunit
MARDVRRGTAREGDRVAAARTLTIGTTSYPLYLPTIRDPRLHVASVIITIHVLGQIGLHFRVSVPQILAAIVTCAIIEVALTFRSSRAFVWPASAMLTGSGVALILRVVGTPADQPWYTDDWWIFATVAGLSLMTKYVIKYRGTHVFNPSNIGLVVAFLVIGSAIVEPLDFWWGPLDGWLLTAYAVIIAGGILITRRLRLLALAATFWVALTIGVGLLAASGHCMTANWAFAPVCGTDFWRIIVTSPEVLIFLFFMITDPKTVPEGRVGRVLFGLLVAIACTLLMAPQTDEWWTKVALLSGLVLVCAARPVIDRLVPEPRSTADELRGFATRVVVGDGRRGAARGAIGISLVVLAIFGLGVGIVAAGSPARGPVVPGAATIVDRLPSQIDPATFPTITVSQDVDDFDHTLAGEGGQELLLHLAQDLELENQALLQRDPTILEAVDHGDRLAEMQERLAASADADRIMVRHYQFEDVELTLVVPFGVQTGLSIGADTTGTVTEELVDASGAVITTTTLPFERTFVMRRALGDRWMIVAEREPEG